MSNINDLPAYKRNKRVNDIDTLISKTNTHIVEALDKIVEIMNDPNAKLSDVLNASAKYIQFYIMFRDKKQEWEDRELKRELLKLNIKQKKEPTSTEQSNELMGFSTTYDGANDDLLRS